MPIQPIMGPSASSIPVEIKDYHALIVQLDALMQSDRLSLASRLQALEWLWHAFQWYIEPFALQWGIQLLEPWPDLQVALFNYAELWYPQQNQLASKSHIQRDTGDSKHITAPDSWQNWLLPPTPPSLSLCMIVKNEMHCLQQSLDSAHELVNEIIIVDTGSTDGTQALVKTYPKVKLFEIPWPDDFGKARNSALQQANCDWILILDADEVILPGSALYLQKLIAHKPLGWHVFAVKIDHQLDTNRFESWAPRLFRNHSDLDFEGPIHELPCKRSWPYFLQTVYLPIRFEHSGNLSQIYQQQKKSQRARQLAQIIQSGNYSPFIAYQYAYLLVHQIDTDGQPQLAEKLLLESLTETQKYQYMLVPKPQHVLAPLDGIVLLLAELYTGQARYQETCQLYQRFSWIVFMRSFYALAAMSQTHLNQLDFARLTWMRCFDPHIGDIKKNNSLQTIALEALLNLALKQEQAEQAIWALRRLRFLFPDGRIHERYYHFQTMENQLYQHLHIAVGSWLYYLDQAIQKAILRSDLKSIAWYALVYLCESWDQTVLCDAIQALHHLQAHDLVLALAQWGRDLYPEQVLFKMFKGSCSTQPLDVYQSQLPGGSYWLKLSTPPQNKPIVNLCMIVKNGANTVLQALKSVEEIVDHYTIADTGSDDSSWKLLQDWAQTHSCDLFELSWQNDFAQARNAVTTRAKGDWVLVLDADEVLLPESIAYLKQVLAYAPDNYQILALLCTHLMSHLNQTSQDHLLRIFARHPSLTYWGAIHEIVGHQERTEFLPINQIDAKIEHIGFRQSEYEKHQKSKRFCLLPQSLKIADYLNPHFAYHFAYALTTHQMSANLEQAIELLQQAIDETLKYPICPPVAGWFPAPLNKANTLLMRIWSHLEKDEVILESYPKWSAQIQDPEYHYWFALAALRQQQYNLAYQGFKNCLNSRRTSQPHAGFGTWKAFLGMTQLALQTQDWLLGLKAWHCLLNDPEAFDVQNLMAQWTEKMLQPASESK